MGTLSEAFDYYVFTSPSPLLIQEVELWEASAHGLIERVRDLLHTVNIDASDIVSFSAF